MINILVDENIPLLKDALRNVSNVSTAAGRDIDRDILIERNTDALIVRSLTKINAELILNTNVKFVGTSTSGIDHVDLNLLKANDIAFAYAPGSNANSVAEYVVYSMLMWSKANTLDLKQSTLGIVGYGNIGKIVAAYANALGLTVYVNDPPLRDASYDFPSYVEYKSLDELCHNSDIITNHVPLTTSGDYPTKGLFGEEQFAAMNEGTFFIHTSRGFVAEEKSLLDKLAHRKIAATVDVWENEPKVNPALVKYCFLATPHIAGYAFDGKLKGALMMSEAIEQFFDFETDKHIIIDELNSGVEKISAASEPRIILNHLEQNRKLREDYLAFLTSMLEEDEKIRGAEFDRMRKEYPHRRECLFL